MNTTQQKNYILPIAVMFSLFFIIAFVTGFAGSMGVIVKSQFNTSNALSQLGTFANFIAYACMGIPAGIILKRKGYKFTALSAIIVGLVGVAIQWLSGYAESFAVYVLGAFVSGFAMCMLNIVGNPMLNTLGGGGNRGNQLIQFAGIFNSIGGTLAPVLLGYLIGSNIETASVADAAPAMLIAMGIFVVAFIVISFTRIPEPHLERKAPSNSPLGEEKAAHGQVSPKGRSTYGPLSFRHFVLGAVAIFFYVGVEVGIPNIANLYMSDHPGLGAEIAGRVVGGYWLMMLFARIIGASIGGKVSAKTMLSTVCCVAIGFLLCVMFLPETITIPLGTVQLPISMLFMLLCGLCTSVMWGAIFNLAAEGLGKYTPSASGIFMALVCGGGVITLLQGFIADYVGYLHSYIVLILCLLYMLWYALAGSKNVNKDIPTN